MNKYFKKVILFGMLVTSLLFLNITSSKADAEESDKSGMGFVYKISPPSNTVSQGNYFDLLMEPGSEQTIVAEITNQMDKDITINILLNDGKTTDSGLIEYGPSKFKNSKSLKIKMKDIVDIPNKIILKKKEVKKLEMKIHLPKEKFEGILLGGIQLQRDTKDSEVKKEQEQTTMIENEYAYVFSLSIRESKEPVKINLEDYSNGVKEKDESREPYIKFSNNSSVIVKDMTVETILTYQDSEEILSEKKMEKMKMAPHSIIKIPFNKKDLDVGDYRTRTKVQIGEEKWTWEDIFSVSKEKEKRKKIHTENKKQGKNWWIISLLAALFVGMVIVIYLVLKRI